MLSTFFENFTEFLAQLSRRLIGEFIVYPWSGVRPSVRPSVRRRSQYLNIFFSETACPIKAKFYVEPPWVGRTKFCSRHVGHMTKIAATGRFPRNLVCSIWESCPSKFVIKDHPGVILTYFTARSNLVT